MIKRKGVCDVCKTEFELDKGSFGITIRKDTSGPSSKRWTINVMTCADGCLDEGFSHVCGLTCLYEAISGVIENKSENPDFRIVGYHGLDDSNIRVIDLKDKKTK